jgi:hypothetical protein
MKMVLDRDERWPDYMLFEEGEYTAPPIEVPDDLVLRYREALAAYDAVQAELGELWHRGER